MNLTRPMLPSALQCMIILTKLLSLQIYMHHYVGATTLLVEGGAELRGRKSRVPVRVWPVFANHDAVDISDTRQVTDSNARQVHQTREPLQCMTHDKELPASTP